MVAKPIRLEPFPFAFRRERNLLWRAWQVWRTWQARPVLCSGQSYLEPSSISPADTGGEVVRGEEVAGCLVATGGDGPELPEPGGEVLDQMAPLVAVAVIRPQ